MSINCAFCFLLSEGLCSVMFSWNWHAEGNIKWSSGSSTNVQYHRMLKSGSNLWSWSGPILLLKKGTIEEVAQYQHHLSRHFFKILKESTSSLGNVRQCSVNCTVKKYFVMFSWNLPCSILCLIVYFWQWAPLKKILLCPFCILRSDIYRHWWDSPWAFSSPG